MAKKKKKKGLTLGLLLLLLAVLIGGLFGLRALNKAQEEKADGETAEEKTYIAVSYTHLDVYKRQKAR